MLHSGPIQAAIDVALDCAELIVAPTDVQEKPDNEGPVTSVDLAVSKRLVEKLPLYPVVSEEHLPPKKIAGKHWLVDPIDGTKDFLRGSDEFGINIALMDGGLPLAGVIYAPKKEELYWSDGTNAYYARGVLGAESVIAPEVLASQAKNQPLRYVSSRSHPDQKVSSTIQQISDVYGQMEEFVLGSSLKFCALARGEADLYIRTQSLKTWDVSAGIAILKASGGDIGVLGRPCREYSYPPFIALAPGLKSELSSIMEFVST